MASKTRYGYLFPRNRDSSQVGGGSSTATSFQHGNLGGGPLHAVATDSIAGFMSASDKEKLDGLNDVLLQPDNPTNNGFGYWDDANEKFQTSSTIIRDGDDIVLNNASYGANNVLTGDIGDDRYATVIGTNIWTATQEYDTDTDAVLYFKRENANRWWTLNHKLNGDLTIGRINSSTEVQDDEPIEFKNNGDVQFNNDIIYDADIKTDFKIVIDRLGNIFGTEGNFSSTLAVGGVASFNNVANFNEAVILAEQATSTNNPVRADRVLTAGNGLTGLGNLTSNRTVTLGTPSTISVTSSNSTSATSHAHNLDLSGRTLTINDNQDDVITWNQNTYNLGANRTWTPSIATHGENQRGVITPNSQIIYGIKIFDGSDVVFNNKVASPDAVSRVSGWQGDNEGNWDFRSIFADSLVVKAFTADVAQAFRGSTFLTKSFATIKESFTVPAVNSTVNVTVAEVEGFAGLDVFEINDYLLVQLVDQSDGGLIVGEVWGEVTSSITDNQDGTQSFTFTTRNLSVPELAGMTLNEGNEMLSFGGFLDPKGFIQSTVLDNLGSPYSQVVTWSNNPWDRSNWTLRTRTGNLAGINFADGFGFYGENTYLTNSLVAGDLSKVGNYIEYENGVLTVDGVIRVEGDEIPSMTTITELQNSIDDLEGLQFGDLAFDNVVETATLGTTIIQGGLIRTSLLDVSDIIANGSILVTGSDVSNLTNDSGFQTSTDVSTQITNFANTLGNLAYDDLVETATLGSTIITGGLIKTTLLDVNSIIASGSIIVSGTNISELNNDENYQTNTDVLQKITNLQLTLGGLAYDDLVETATLGSTIITGGFIKTDLLDVDDIFSNNIAVDGILNIGTGTHVLNGGTNTVSLSNGIFTANNTNINMAGWSVTDGSICQEYESGEFMTLSTNKTDKSDYKGFSIYRKYNSIGANYFRLLRIGELSGVDTTNSPPKTYGIQIGKGTGQAYQDVFRIDSSGEFILRTNGLVIEDGDATFSGNLQAVGGTFSGSLDAVNGTFSGDLQAVNGSLNNLDIDGKLKMGSTGSISDINENYRITDDGIDFNLINVFDGVPETRLSWTRDGDSSESAYITAYGDNTIIDFTTLRIKSNDQIFIDFETKMTISSDSIGYLFMTGPDSLNPSALRSVSLGAEPNVPLYIQSDEIMMLSSDGSSLPFGDPNNTGQLYISTGGILRVSGF